MNWIPLGLISWLIMGLAIGISAVRWLPGAQRLGWLKAVSSAIAGALAGGLLATSLGFGGLIGYDIRALVTATLSALLLTLVMVIAGLRPEEAP